MPDAPVLDLSQIPGSGTGSGNAVGPQSRVYVGSAAAPVPGSGGGKAPIFKTVEELKKGFLTLTPADKKILSDKLVALGQKPSNASMRTLWNQAVDNAALGNLQGVQIAPLDVVVNTMPAIGTQPYGAGGANLPQQTIYTIDANGAKALLQKQARGSGLDTQFSTADINAFKNEYNAQAAKQAQTSITKVVNGKNVTTYQPSAFSANDFADQWLWARTDMGDPKLAGQALSALQSVQAIVKGNGLDHVSDIEIKNLAKQVASGVLKIGDVQTEMGQQAAMYYPQFADRLAKNPTATVSDLAKPYISNMATRLELDPATISLSDPTLDKALRPDGTAGKVASMSLADFNMSLMNDKRWENTTAANDAARSSATGLLRAFGYGV